MRQLVIISLLIAARIAVADDPQPLPGTKPLTWAEADGALADRLMDGAHTFVERKIAESKDNRARYWRTDFSSDEAYEQSVAPNRERFRTIIGVVDDERTARITMERFGDEQNSALVAETEELQIHQIRWPVLDGVFSEGLVVTPKQRSDGYTIFVPDADQTPEQLIGLSEGDSDLRSRLRHAAADGQTIIIPTLISRRIFLGPDGDDARLKRSDQTHREWIYRQAFHMGRHIIGYEVQKVLAAVDWIEKNSPDAPVRVQGGHAINGRATFAFLHKHLDWREPD